MTRTKKTGKISATITHQARKSHFDLITTKRGTSCEGSFSSSKDSRVLYFGPLCLTHFIHEQNLLIIFYGRGSSICKSPTTSNGPIILSFFIILFAFEQDVTDISSWGNQWLSVGNVRWQIIHSAASVKVSTFSLYLSYIDFYKSSVTTFHKEWFCARILYIFQAKNNCEDKTVLCSLFCCIISYFWGLQKVWCWQAHTWNSVMWLSKVKY